MYSGARSGNGLARITLVANGTEWDYYYTKEVETFNAPFLGGYKLEVWGAEGGASIGEKTASGGKGGYSVGEVFLNAGDELYIAVGGKGTKGKKKTVVAGGWNGGGKGSHDNGLIPSGANENSEDNWESAGGGDGATHIASTLRGTGVLADYSDYRNEVLIVAGGGGGASFGQSGGKGGGLTGGKNKGTSSKTVDQTTGYAFGKGQDGSGYGYSNGVAGGRRWLVWWICK